MIKGVLRTVQNFESSKDVKLVISIVGEHCPVDIMKYRHEEVGVILDMAEVGTSEVTMNRQEQLQTLLGHADTIADAAMKLVAMAREELQGLEPGPEDYGTTEPIINN